MSPKNGLYNNCAGQNGLERGRNWGLWTGACAAILACCTLATESLAQNANFVRRPDVERNDTVVDRERSEVDALGVRAGSFRVFPTLDVEEVFDDNIFSTSTREVSDQITVISPTVVVNSDWTRHAVSLMSGANIGFHTDNPNEDYEDYRLGASGRFDVSSNTSLSASTLYMFRHGDRDSTDDSAGTEPSEYEYIINEAEIFHRFGRFNVALGGILERFDFDDTPALLGGLPIMINEDDRDRNHYVASLRVGYQIQPTYEAYVKGSYVVNDYDSSFDDATFDRDSEGFEMVAGVRIDFGGLMFGDFYGGFQSHDIDDSRLDTSEGASFGAELTWLPTGMTNVIGTIERRIEETTSIGSAGRFVTFYGLRVDHELRRNLIISPFARLRQDDFKQIGGHINTVRTGLIVNYMMNRRMHLTADYEYINRNSNITTQDYKKNLVRLRLRLQL